MFQPGAEITRKELREGSRRLLVRRLRIVLWIDVFALALFVAGDLLGLMPEPIAEAFAIYGIEFAIVASALVALRRPGIEDWALAMAVLVTVSSIVSAASLGIVTHDLVTAPLVYIILAMATATLFPWGLGPQAVTVTLAGLATLWNFRMASRSLAPAFDYPTMTMLVAFAGSLYIAYEFERYRLAIEQRNLELRGYRDVVENANDAILTFDREGRITGVNAGAESLFGCGREGLLGQHRDEIFRVVDPRGFAESWEEAMRGTPSGRIFSIEGRRRDGRLVPLEVKARTLPGESAAEGTQAILRDVTEKRIAEQMRNDFVAMLSHDMKTPLGSILGFAEMLGDELGDDSELRPLVDRIEANARMAHGLAVNFVDVARIESGSLQLHLESTSLNDIVDHVLQHQETMARAREISIEATLAANLPELSLDRRQIDRVVANLVSNAIKFSPLRGRIRIDTERRGGRVVLAVRDQGPGIAPEDRAQLFQRFRRLDGRFTEGSGLGLYIVKQIVEAHGGEVHVDCPAEGGAVFEVSFEERPLAA